MCHEGCSHQTSFMLNEGWPQITSYYGYFTLLSLPLCREVYSVTVQGRFSSDQHQTRSVR
jgi:hypothetical protein